MSQAFLVAPDALPSASSRGASSSLPDGCAKQIGSRPGRCPLGLVRLVWSGLFWFLLAGWTPLSLCAQQAASGEVAASELLEWSGLTMGPITYKVIVVAPPQFDVESLQARVTSTLERINARMSTYQAESEVSRFNRSDRIDWFEVSEETARVVARAQELSRDSSGAFDITVKPLVELWNFGAGKGEFKLPSEEQVQEAKRTIGWEKLEVRLEPAALRKSDPGIQIDLSAIAKGYAVDAVAADIRAAGLADFFVEIGGEAVAQGTKPGAIAWKVGVERPQDVGQSVQRVVELQNQAIATSGDYRNFAIVEGQRYSHEIDPSSGWPIRNGVASATILAADCMTADGLATAVMILGPEKSKELLAKYQSSAYFLTRRGEGFEELATVGFPAVPASVPAVEAGPLSNLLPVFLATLGLFLLAVTGLLVGVLFSNKPLRGSCGGMSAATGEASSCGLCGGQPADCSTSGESSAKT
jgi:thiamine biosynthesis lipoprotein